MLTSTEAKVVVSSTWRKLFPLDLITKHMKNVALPEELLPRFIDITPTSRKGFRGDEVQAWLNLHPEVKKYAIVDDDSDFHDYQLPFFVQTAHATGLLDEQAQRLIELLT